MSVRRRGNRKNSRRLKIFKEDKNLNDTQRCIRIRKFRTKKRKGSTVYKVPIKLHKTKIWREPKPLVDIFERDDEVVVVAELAGFSRENLRVTTKDKQLILSAEALNRKYYKSLNLPSQVIQNTLRTAYKNGVLEVRLKKAVKKKSIDKMAGLKNAT